ncbi:MAG: hypothetical protein ACRBCI_08945 [Cellvibrionaceae bacterium]
MLALKEPGRVYIDKPMGTRIQRQISRMIKHFRDQYHIHHSLHAMPSSWLIEELVINAAKSYILQCDDWQLRVRMTLKQIIRDTSYDDCLYINSRTNLPLFPNNELFDAWEVHQTMIQLLNYLDDEG